MELVATPKTFLRNFAGWSFGILVLLIGILNIFWGNDPGYGIFLVLLSFVYYPPTDLAFSYVIGRRLPLWFKFVLGAFILWSAIGVGELFPKIKLMMDSF